MSSRALHPLFTTLHSGTSSRFKRPATRPTCTPARTRPHRECQSAVVSECSGVSASPVVGIPCRPCCRRRRPSLVGQVVTGARWGPASRRSAGGATLTLYIDGAWEGWSGDTIVQLGRGGVALGRVLLRVSVRVSAQGEVSNPSLRADLRLCWSGRCG